MQTAQVDNRCEMQTAGCRLWARGKCRLRIKCRLQSAGCRPGIKCRLHNRGEMQTEEQG